MITRTMTYFDLMDNETREHRYYVSNDRNIELLNMLMNNEKYSIEKKTQKIYMQDADFIRYAFKKKDVNE